MLGLGKNKYAQSNNTSFLKNDKHSFLKNPDIWSSKVVAE